MMLRASVVDARGTRDARISDISTRGMLGNMASPPKRGEFITIIFPSQEVAGQVRWTKGRQFGVDLRENLDVNSLFSRATKPRKKGVVLASDPNEIASTPMGMMVAYLVLGITALAAAYLIYIYLIR